MGVVRPLQRDDLIDVANLITFAFHDRQEAASPALVSYLTGLFVDFPDRDPDINSLVHLDEDGRITAFIGVVGQTMIYEGRPLRMAMANSFAADKRSRDPMAPGLLLRAYLQGPQDISLSDRANATSVAMWRSLRRPTFPLYSLDWLRVLHPAGYAASRAITRQGLGRFAVPLIRSVDAAIERRAAARGGSPWALAPTKPIDGLSIEDVDGETFAQIVPGLISDAPLYPSWTPTALARILADAAQKSEIGGAVRQTVRTKSGTPVGAYFYHVRQGGVATTVQVLARKGQAGTIIDCLLADAAARGAVAVGGRAQPALIEPLMDRGASFTSPQRCLADARDKAVLATIERGEAAITGLVGEYWMRLNGDALN